VFEILLATDKDDYTFLSYGESYNDTPDFLALFMPFSKTTWALIFITIFGWPLVLSLIENDFKWQNVLKDFDVLFIGWAMILEQSHFRAANYKGRGPLYCYCGCVIFAIFILSNAFNGDNIQVLAKLFELVPLTHMDEIVRAGYKTYSVNVCLRRSEFYSPRCTDQFYMEAYRRINDCFTILRGHTKSNAVCAIRCCPRGHQRFKRSFNVHAVL